MEPPKIIREVDPSEGRGCWMGCFGIGCLVMVVGAFGLLVGGYYGVFHTGWPLALLERELERDGQVQIEGMTGSLSSGVKIDELKFLTVDKEHWSVLRGVKFDYNGILNMTTSGRVIIEQMSVDSGTIYADIEGPDDFMFSPGDISAADEFRDSDISEVRVDLLEVSQLKIVNLDTDYAIEIENASLKGFRADGTTGIQDLGELTVKSNLLEISTQPSTQWPDSPGAKQIRGTMRSKFAVRLKQDVDFTLDIDLTPDAQRQSLSMFNGSWKQESSKRQRSMALTDFTAEEYFESNQVLPAHVQLIAERKVASREKGRGDRDEDQEDRDRGQGAESETGDLAGEYAWKIAPGASFQLGKTTFQIISVDGNRTPLRLIIGTATVNNELVTAELRCRDYFQKGPITLKIGDQIADRTDWAQVVFGQEFDALSRDQQRMIEATITASKESDESPEEKSDAESDTESDDSKSDDEPKAEAEDDAPPVDSKQDDGGEPRPDDN